jgi:hypothetical protein
VVREVDLSYKVTPRMIFRRKIQNFDILVSIHTLISLNQGSIFKLWECAQSIFRIKLPLEKSFLQKFQKFFFLGDAAAKFTPLKKIKNSNFLE